jgi:hypothetical protein
MAISVLGTAGSTTPLSQDRPRFRPDSAFSAFYPFNQITNGSLVIMEANEP